ncbi:hypothetical protein ACTWP5_01505 [Streptomyces sp. 4N509B]|uniref:hypothetical protein n=1 Tax=Streptomyces sp. 4N509B TaxID=3457413 RepID=UPI003FD439FD
MATTPSSGSPSSGSPSSGRLTADAAEALVRRLHREVTDRVPVGRLTPHLANGLRLDLPGRVVRGLADFRRWYASGRHRPLTGADLALTDVEVRLLSPVHAEVRATVTAVRDSARASAQGSARGGPGSEQTWLVVLQNGHLLVRTVSVEPLSPETTSPQAALAHAA